MISVITHGIIFFQNAHLNSFSTTPKEEKIEISYLKNPEKPKEPPRGIFHKKEMPLKLPPEITAKKINPPPFITKENSFPRFTKPAFIKPDIIAIKKKITLPPMDMNRINNPSYISYYQIVREKIRRSAYQNYTRTETGEVYLSFIISDDGLLKETRVVEEKSTNAPYLKETALRSIKDASPFPNFPKELDYPQLSFNVVISFEIE